MLIGSRPPEESPTERTCVWAAGRKTGGRIFGSALAPEAS